MTSWEIGLLLLGAAAGGFVNGMTGFGTALTAVPIWLQVFPPAQAGALGAAAGVTGQLQTIHQIWHAISLPRVLPFLIPALAGVPIGTWLLPFVDLRHFKLGVGLVLIVYCAFNLIVARLKLSASIGDNRFYDAVVGLIGGVMSGLAGLAGPAVIIWATFKPWSRDDKRALFQVFNLTVLSATLLSSAIAGLLPKAFWIAVAITVPATFAGVQAGYAVYRRLDDRRYDRLVLAILLAMGLSLVVANI